MAVGGGKWTLQPTAIRHPLVAPYFGAFTAIGADVNVLTTRHQLLTERPIIVVVPDFPERLSFQITQLMLCVFVEATRYHHAIPGDHIGMPEFPAVVVEFI